MRLLRITVAIFLALAAMMAFLLAMPGDEAMLERTIAHSREIEESFRKIASSVDEYIRTTGRLPTEQQFSAWAESLPQEEPIARNIWITLPPFSAGFISEYGAPPKNGYVLGYWRGEWEETYISWTKKFSMTFERSDYYMFGSPRAQMVYYILIGLALALASSAAWPARLEY
jgi:hypothetical protein